MRERDVSAIRQAADVTFEQMAAKVATRRLAPNRLAFQEGSRAADQVIRRRTVFGGRERGEAVDDARWTAKEIPRVLGIARRYAARARTATSPEARARAQVLASRFYGVASSYLNFASRQSFNGINPRGASTPGAEALRSMLSHMTTRTATSNITGRGFRWKTGRDPLLRGVGRARVRSIRLGSERVPAPKPSRDDLIRRFPGILTVKLPPRRG